MFNQTLLDFDEEFCYATGMGDIELWHSLGMHETQGVEILNGRHFYAANVFDRAENRRVDVQAILEHATWLGYPVRYW